MAQRTYKTKSRRANNEGSIYQRKDGLWAGMATVGYDDDGKIKRKVVYGKSKLEVANKLTELTKRISNNNYELIENSTLGVLMKEWLLVFKKNTVSARTFEGNIRNYELHIAPLIGNMKLDEISHVTIQKILNDMLDKDYSLTVVKKVKFLLNQFFNYVVDNNLITINPVMKTRVKSNEKKIYDSENKYKAIPQEIRNKFIECLNEHSFLKPFCLTMMFGGLRVGEALALTWENIDFENNTINVEKASTNIPKFDANGKIIDRQQVISTTKTACSVREVPMPNILIDALNEYKEKRKQDSIFNKVNLIEPEMLVFGNDDGSLRTYSGTKTIFSRFLAKHNLTGYGIRFHGLRHTYSNTLFEANQNPKVIQGLLGHKSVKTTITSYNSVDKSYFKQATEVFNKEYQTGGKPAEIREEITPQKELSEKSKQELEDEIERLSLLIKIKELEKQKEELEERQYIKKKKEKDFEM